MKKWQTYLVLFAAFALGTVTTSMFSGCQRVPADPEGGTDVNATTPDVILPAEERQDSADDAADAASTPSAAADAEAANASPPKAATFETADEKAAAAPAADAPVADATDAPEPPAAEPAEAKAESADSTPAAREEPVNDSADQADGEASSARKTPAAAVQAEVASGSPVDPSANAAIEPGDWPQWGGTSYRNNTPLGQNIPVDWAVGDFDRETQEWIPDDARNVKWVARVGSQTYGNPVVAGGNVYVGTNNQAGWLARYPSDIDLGCLLCFDEQDGSFRWQDSSEKLPTGRVHDWPLQGICCAPYVEGDRLWFVTSRGEVKCLDTEGFYDDEDDGPVQNQWARLFEQMRSDDADQDQVAPIVAALEDGRVEQSLRDLLGGRGLNLPEEVAVTTQEAGKKWLLEAQVDGVPREVQLTLAGPKLSAFKKLTTADKHESDVVWVLDMMSELAVSQHNMCSCSVTALGDILFVNTSNGLDESHINLPSPQAPSFIALDKNTGEVYWTDRSPGTNILHGQWSSPAVAELGGVPQVIFAGGDGWVYSFRADKGKDGKPELLWKFDANPKESKWILGGRGTRNNIIATPVIYDGLVYVAVGQDPEHGEGIGHLWCINPQKRGDVSPQLAVKIEGDSRQPIPHKRIQAVDPEQGEVAVDNPNSAVVWHFSEYDRNGDGEIEFEETMHRSCGTVAIKDDLLFIADFSGLFHCLDAKSGKVHWAHDMLAAAWGSPLIVENRVYIGDEDGDVSVFNLSADPAKAMKEMDGEMVPINADELGYPTNMGNSVYSTPIVANNVLFIANRTHLFAIASEDQAAE